jgi:o-succinylbenzoate---CoA ligase
VRLIDPLRRALEGSGPAIMPVDGGLPASQLAALLDAFSPDEICGGGERTVRSASGEGRGRRGVWEDTAVIVGTSGSTGAPKGVELSAAALRASARASMARVGARPGQRWLVCLPVTHVAGLQVLVRSLEAGTDPVVAAAGPAGRAAVAGDRKPWDAASLADAVGQGAAHVSMVPTQLVRVMGSPAAREALAQFSSVVVGGAAAAAPVLAAARAAGVAAVATYGMSETCGGCVYDGAPLDGVSVRSDSEGRLRISGPVLMNRYHGQPGLTSAALVPGGAGAGGLEFVTSDLGHVGADGRVVVRGRADDVINTGGHKVVPGEVAAVLASCPGVREAVVVGRPDPEWGERVTAVIVPDDRECPPTLELLRIHVRAALPRYACPSEVVLAEAIPVLSNGKPDLVRLRRGTAEGRVLSQHGDGPNGRQRDADGNNLRRGALITYAASFGLPGGNPLAPGPCWLTQHWHDGAG